MCRGTKSEIFLAVPIFQIVPAHFAGLGKIAYLILLISSVLKHLAGIHIHLEFLVFVGKGKILCAYSAKLCVGLYLQII